MKLQYVIICENAFTDEAGRLTIVQTFDIIKTQGFPAIHPKMTIVTKWRFESSDAKDKPHSQRIEITSQDDQKKPFLVIPEFALTAKDKDHNNYLQYISNLQNIAFHKPGKYQVKIFMDGKEAREVDTIFEVQKESK